MNHALPAVFERRSFSAPLFIAATSRFMSAVLRGTKTVLTHPNLPFSHRSSTRFCRVVKIGLLCPVHPGTNKSMKYWKWILICALAAAQSCVTSAAMAGTNMLPPEVLRALNAPEKATLYSIDPVRSGFLRPTFHGYRILGSARLTGKQQRIAIWEFESAVSNWNGITAECFNPRHGLRVISGGQAFDLVLCFECHQVEIFAHDKLTAELGATGTPEVLNAILKRTGVPLAPPGE